MATLTIRDLDDRVKQTLRERAARHGVSMEQEARLILRDAVLGQPRGGKGEWRLAVPREKILALGRKPARPFDLKAISDHMWDEGLLW